MAERAVTNDEDDAPSRHPDRTPPQAGAASPSATSVPRRWGKSREDPRDTEAPGEPPSTGADEPKGLSPQALAILQSCWNEFAQQNALSDEESRKILARTQQLVEKRKLHSVEHFATAPSHRWPAKMTPRLVDMIRKRAQDKYVATGSVDEKRQRLHDDAMDVDDPSYTAQTDGEARSGSSTDNVIVDSCVAASGNTTAYIPLSDVELMSIHLVDAIVQKGLIEERRQKYLTRWASTFIGSFRIFPPEVTDASRNADILRKISKFEFFMWSNIRPQPTIDYIKQRIGQATRLHASHFKLATMWGEQLPYNAVAIEAYERLLTSEHLQSTFMLQKKPVVALRIVANAK